MFLTEIVKMLWRKMGVQAVRFTIIGGIGTLMSLALLYIFTDIIGLWYMTSAIITTFIVYGWNFYGQRSYAFSRGKHPFTWIENKLTKRENNQKR